MPLQIGKTPIVVPRQHQFNEHVNDHQVEFARNVAQRMGTIIEVEDIENLGEIITNYDQIVAGMGHGMSSNNAKFNEELEKLVDELYCEGKDSAEGKREHPQAARDGDCSSTEQRCEVRQTKGTVSGRVESNLHGMERRSDYSNGSNGEDGNKADNFLQVGETVRAKRRLKG